MKAKRWLVYAAAGVVAVSGIIVGTLAAEAGDGGGDVPPRLQGIPANKVGPAEGRAISSGTIPPVEMQRIQAFRDTPRTPAPSICGGPSPAGVSVTTSLAAEYGEVRNCLQAGSTWVVVTAGFPPDGATGVIALYPCSTSDSACMSGDGSYPIGNWQIVRPPYPGPLKVMARAPGDPLTLILNDGHHSVIFDVDMGTFAARTRIAP